MHIVRLSLLTALAVLAAPLSFAADASKPVPLSAFFDSPSMSRARISPDGKRLAILFNNSSNKGYDQLGVIDLADNAIKVAAAFSDGDVNAFEWVNNTRLVYNSRDKTTAQGMERFAPGLYAVNADGSARRQLVKLGNQFVTDGKLSGREILPWNTFLLGQQGAQDSNAVYVVQVAFGHDGAPDVADLLELDTMSATYKHVKGPGSGTLMWMLDATGRPALAGTVDGKEETLHYLDPKTGQWRAFATQDLYLGGKDAIAPLGFTPQGQLYVVGHGGRDTLAPFAYDLASAKMAAQPLVNMPEYDFNGDLVIGGGKLLGIRYVADGEGTVWFDPAMKAMQETVDKLLPGRINRLSVGVRSETPFVLVETWSDRQPRQFVLFNRTTGKLSKLGEMHPAIEAARMGPLELVSVKARDGEGIPTWVTLPAGGKGKNLPTVVLVHGGPYLRGSSWRWGAERQFLASRGYAVVEPEFRGSTGYGDRHFRAGWKQWGLGMQDDIADATRWAVAQGIADPKRICIAGASYGGYATLMGLVRDPDLYKCGVEWVGVTDIDMMFNGHWGDDSDMTDTYKRYGMPALVGDPVKDAAQFAATSPLKQAARVTQPLLMAYGGADHRVPLYHGKQFLSAVRQTNRHVEWVVYDDEGHGWKLLQTRLDFWARVEKFLQQQIGSKE